MLLTVLCVFSWLQNAECNGTSVPYTNLFPLNNDTLEVDIYKGVCLVINTTAVNPCKMELLLKN